MMIFKKLTLLFTLSVMSLSMGLMSCEKEQDANPVSQETITPNALFVATEQMPEHFIVMDIPKDYQSPASYTGVYYSFTETVVKQTASGPVTVEYYLKADDNGQVVTMAFEPTALRQLGIAQNHFLTPAGTTIFPTASEGLIGCLLGGGRWRCWLAFAIGVIDLL